ncbi:PA2778 family cysteine peptidase [Pseudomonas anguilliseptica]|uniref:PA2778 family cysteine peptidase n=1 Tax=Pseudomonas anguilliseptica TaxID=53406 RepID=UPI001428CD84|nr:PA2778 family cysteine peptidase [Pseudomonas anguilliseptica]
MRVVKLLPFALSFLLSACASGPQLLPETKRLPERVELADVPFFQLSDAQGGPSALAALLNHHGVITSPGLVDERIQQLTKGQSAQAGLEAVARSYDLLVYPLPGNLDVLMQQVSAGHPVLVMQDRLFGGPGAHFALLVGYDQRERTLVLRSGNTQRWYTSFASFDDAWGEAGRWAVLVMPTNQLPEQPLKQAWLTAVQELQEQGRTAAAQRALRTAHQVWPDAQL